MEAGPSPQRCADQNPSSSSRRRPNSALPRSAMNRCYAHHRVPYCSHKPSRGRADYRATHASLRNTATTHQALISTTNLPPPRISHPNSRTDLSNRPATPSSSSSANALYSSPLSNTTPIGRRLTTHRPLMRKSVMDIFRDSLVVVNGDYRAGDDGAFRCVLRCVYRLLMPGAWCFQ